MSLVKDEKTWLIPFILIYLYRVTSLEHILNVVNKVVALDLPNKTPDGMKSRKKNYRKPQK